MSRQDLQGYMPLRVICCIALCCELAPVARLTCGGATRWLRVGTGDRSREFRSLVSVSTEACLESKC
jgi:hypothetical protein